MLTDPKLVMVKLGACKSTQASGVLGFNVCVWGGRFHTFPFELSVHLDDWMSGWYRFRGSGEDKSQLVPFHTI